MIKLRINNLGCHYGSVAAVKDLNTSARYAHPWFGPLDAAGWHALAAGHLQIHRQQIERIVEGLRARNLPNYATNQPTKMKGELYEHKS